MIRKKSVKKCHDNKRKKPNFTHSYGRALLNNGAIYREVFESCINIYKDSSNAQDVASEVS